MTTTTTKKFKFLFLMWIKVEIGFIKKEAKRNIFDHEKQNEIDMTVWVRNSLAGGCWYELVCCFVVEIMIHFPT